MKKRVVGLAVFAMLFSLNTKAYADTTASQAITGTLAEVSDVSFYGGTVHTTINTVTGNISSALDPTFEVINNDAAAKTLEMTSSITTTTGDEDAFFDDAGTPYIILANTTHPPTAAAITDIKGVSTDPINNPNAIAYQATGSDTNGSVTYNVATDLFDVSSNSGKDYVTLTLATAAMANTYCPLDLHGDYSSTITLSITGP